MRLAPVSEQERFVGLESEAYLEEQATLYGLHIVRGRLHLFSKAEVEAAEAVMEKNRKFIGDWIDSAANYVSSSYESLKNHFTGAEAEFGQAIDSALAHVKQEEKNLVAGVIGKTMDMPKEKKTSFLDSVIASLTANAGFALDQLTAFCHGLACFSEPSVDNCAKMKAFQEIEGALSNGTDMKATTWSAQIKQYAIKAAMRMFVHAMSVTIKAARLAIDMVPGGEIITHFLNSMRGQCLFVTSGTAKQAVDCFLQQLKDASSLIKALVEHWHKREFGALVSLFKQHTGGKSKMFGPEALLTCVIETVKKEAVQAANTAAKPAPATVSTGSAASSKPAGKYY